MKPAVTKALRDILTRSRQHKLLPAKVVEAAKDPNSPLHRYFTWDDSKAAQRYRIIQARQLIVEIEIVVDEPKRREPVFVSLIMDRRDGGYREVEAVIQNESLRKELLRTALTELRGFQMRYERLRELANVFRAIKKVERNFSQKSA